MISFRFIFIVAAYNYTQMNKKKIIKEMISTKKQSEKRSNYSIILIQSDKEEIEIAR